MFFVCIELSYCQQQGPLPGIDTLEFIRSVENMFYQPHKTDQTRGFPLEIEAFPEVTTEVGTFVGQTNKNSHAFYAIPFAEPPIGELRLEINIRLMHIMTYFLSRF